MLIKLPKIDRKAALLAGYEVGPVCTVEVDMAALGDDRAALVEALELHEDGSATLGLVVPVPTVEAIVGAVRAAAADWVAQAVAAERSWRELLGEFEAAAALLEQLEPVRCEKMLRDGNGSAIGIYSGWRKPEYREISVYVRQTLVQIVTPDNMRGRVASVSGLFIGASNELGEFESGLVARFFGPVGAAIFGGVGAMIVTGVWSQLFPALRKADRLA